MPERNILDMLANLAHWTAWPSHLGPPSGSESKLTDPVQRSLCCCGSAPRPPAPAGLLHAVESQLHMAEHTLGAAPKERRHGGAIVGDVLACRCGSRQYRLRPTTRSGPSRRLNNAVPDVPRHARCQVRDRDTRIGIALQGAQAGRLWRLLGERLTDEEKTAP